MKSRKMILVGLVILATIWLTSAADAGLSIKLEKDVLKRQIKGVPIDVSFKIFESDIANTPITSQTFSSGSWSHRYVSQAKFRPFPLRPKKGTGMVRFMVDFTNTAALTKDMQLWMEIELDGVKKGTREKIKQEAWALFSEEAFLADEATHAINADNATYAATAGDADTVDGAARC